MPAAFDPKTTKFNPQNALFLAIASDIAYDQDQKAAKKRARDLLGLDNFHAFDTLDTQGFVGGNDDFVVVAFRGTETSKIADWMTDVEIAPVNFNYLFQGANDIGHVHNGFGHALVDVWEEVFATIKEFSTKGQSLWFTGHSLGGALAVIATAACLFDDNHRIAVNGLYTYGQPRVGDHDFAMRLDGIFRKKTFRLVNNADIVTRVPPRSLGYHVNGSLLYFDKAGVAHNDDSFWNQFLNEVVVGLDVAQNFPSVVKDHDLKTGYIDHILKYIEDVNKGLRKPLVW